MSQSKVWLVTGASSGLGLAMALAALRAGHKVVAGARTPEKAAKTYPELESLGGRWVQLDVTSQKTQQIVEQVVKDEGRIDVVVNNAGYAVAGTVEDVTEQEFHKVMDTMYYGAIRVLKGALPYMRAHKSGTIVNMSSIFGFVPCCAAMPYNGVKFAIEGLSESLNADLTPFDIRIILLEPGLFRTEVLARCVYPDSGIGKDYQETFIGENLKAVKMMAANPETTHPGDPNKLGERVVEYVDRTGMAKDIDPKHLRLVLGPDSLMQIKEKMKQLQANFDAMEAIANSTNYEGFGADEKNAGINAIPSLRDESALRV